MRFIRSITASAAAVAVALAAAGCTPTEDPAGAAPDNVSAAPVVATPSTTATSSPSTSGTADSPTPSSTVTSGAASAPTSSTASAQGQDPTPARAGTALAALESLPVKGRAPKTGYDREQFGQAWADTDRNGCDTRNDILARDLAGETFKADTRDCVVASGVLEDPYTATEIHFVRGQDTSNDVQIDHVVALSDAWQKGAQQLSAAERTAFANDPLNLLAVDGPINSQKSDSDAASWLPPNRSFRCDFVARQIAVKVEYDLWVTAAENEAMARVLSSCPDQLLPTDDTAARAYTIETRSTQSATPVSPSMTQAPTPKRTAPAPAPTSQTPKTSAPKTQAPAPANVYFKNCTAARDAGAAPVRIGDPGYARHLDRDGDGVGCE